LRKGEKGEPAFLGGKNAGVWFGGKGDLETLEFVFSSSLFKFLPFYYSLQLRFLMFLLLREPSLSLIPTTPSQMNGFFLLFPF